MSYNIGEIINKYIDLRDRKAALAKKHDEELRVLTEPMGSIENYLMHTMNTMGVSQLKEDGVGTAFKATSTSVQLKEPEVFRAFVFEPATTAIVQHLIATGIHVNDQMVEAIHNIVRDLPRWDVVDLRAGKKGIQEYIENSERPVPGVTVNSITTVSIRRA